MSDYIKRKDAVFRISDLLMSELKGKRLPTWEEVFNAIGDIPAADVVEQKGNKPKTNADRIRAMTDEELSHFIADLFMQFRKCPEDEDRWRSFDCLNHACSDCWLEWLKQEADA